MDTTLGGRSHEAILEFYDTPPEKLEHKTVSWLVNIPIRNHNYP